AEACAEAGIDRLVQISAVGGHRYSQSRYARTKAAGEMAVAEAQPSATILRPSIVFGPEDEFFNRFAAMARISPFLPLIGGGKTRFQPVYVEDVAEAAIAALEQPKARGEIFELGGPQVYSFREILEFILKVTHRKRLFLPMPFFAAKMLGGLVGWLPGAPITLDQAKQLEVDNVVADDAKTLADLGIEAECIEAIVPSYLARFRRLGLFEHDEWEWQS
ncbi:MAG: complex I NDUFA9 subunit family protein, partial [Alphaproteobacteria bacterium]|nr:complex I NDUFA9 subunit family protein [Alphaproteobacteria bacterium]